MLFDKFFWFVPPSSILSNADWIFGYIFAGFIALSIILWVVKRFTKNQIAAKLIGKFFNLFLYNGISGAIWFGFRYENTPVFGQRYWAGLVFLILIVWLLFILKYLVFNFSKELTEYNHELVKKRYMP